MRGVLVESGLTQDSEIIEFQLISYRRRVKQQALPARLSVWEATGHCHGGRTLSFDLQRQARPIGMGGGAARQVSLLPGDEPIIAIVGKLGPARLTRYPHWRAEEAYATVCSADASLQGASQLIDGFFHADETLWRVFEKLAGKVGYRWYLWVFRSRSVCFLVRDPSRAAAVPLAHVAQLLAEAIVVCERYSAYKKMARTLGILWAFCWAHVRRDFLELARGDPQLEPWAMQWVERIGTLYPLNGLRLKARAKSKADVAQGHARLSEHLGQMWLARDQGLADRPLPPQARKLLQSLQRHWQGLTVFLEHPEVPLDNNSAEQAVRKPVCARKN